MLFNSALMGMMLTRHCDLYDGGYEKKAGKAESEQARPKVKGQPKNMIPGITEGTICYPAGYLNLTKEDVTEILKESM